MSKRRYPEYVGDSASLRADEISIAMEASLIKAAQRIEVLTGHYPSQRVTVNRDLTVDGELRYQIERWEDIADIVSAISDAGPGRRVPESWVSVGSISYPKPGEVVTGIPGKIDGKKIQRYATYWQFADRVATNALNYREGVMVELKRKRRRMPRELYVRVHWNPKGMKPEGR